MEGLCLEPCLPPDWEECAIVKEFRGCRYVITYHQKKEGAGVIDRILVDDTEVIGNLLPYKKGRECEVEVYLK